MILQNSCFDISIRSTIGQSTSTQDPDDFGFLDPDPQKYADPRIRVQYQPKTEEKNFFTLKPKISFFEKKERL